MPEPTRPTCETCPYWDRINDYADCPDDTPYAVCRRHAPKPRVYSVGPNEELDVDCEPRWPQVRPVDDFCGDHPDFPAYIAALKAETPTGSPHGPWCRMDA